MDCKMWSYMYNAFTVLGSGTTSLSTSKNIEEKQEQWKGSSGVLWTFCSYNWYVSCEYIDKNINMEWFTFLYCLVDWTLECHNFQSVSCGALEPWALQHHAALSLLCTIFFSFHYELKCSYVPLDIRTIEKIIVWVYFIRG